MSDVWICVVKISDEGTGPSMDRQVGVTSLIVTRACCPSNTCKEEADSKRTNHCYKLKVEYYLEEKLSSIKLNQQPLEGFFDLARLCLRMRLKVSML